MTWFDWATSWIRWDRDTLRNHEIRIKNLEDAMLVVADAKDLIELTEKLRKSSTPLAEAIKKATEGEL